MAQLTRPRPVDGEIEEQFWAYVKANELRVQECAKCQQLRYPPGAFCPNCLGFEFDWKCLSGNGAVVSWVWFHRQYFPGLPPPYNVVLVAMDEGPLMMANLLDIPSTGIREGMRVQVAFEAVDDDWTIFQFRPDGDGGGPV